MAGRAGEGLRKLGGEACYLNCNTVINRAGEKIAGIHEKKCKKSQFHVTKILGCPYSFCEGCT